MISAASRYLAAPVVLSQVRMMTAGGMTGGMTRAAAHLQKAKPNLPKPKPKPKRRMQVCATVLAIKASNRATWYLFLNLSNFWIKGIFSRSRVQDLECILFLSFVDNAVGCCCTYCFDTSPTLSIAALVATFSCGSVHGCQAVCVDVDMLRVW